MKAVVIHEHGDVDKLRIEEVDTPSPAPDEVLIQVKACALNYLDLWVRKGVPGQRMPLPMIPGCDIAGVVKKAGSFVKGVKTGDRVVVAPGVSCGRCARCLNGQDNLCASYGIIGENRDGGCAEYVCVPGVNVMPIPGKLTFNEAAAIPLVFLTAWHMLMARARVRPGEDVLVHAAGSGVGSAGIQIAKLLGARVIATAGSDAKLKKARELGADETINYRKLDFYDEVKKITRRQGVDVILDHIGADTWDRNIRSLRMGGRLVTCGVTSGFEVATDIRYIFFRRLSVLGSTMGTKGELLEIMRMVERGALKPVIDSVFPLADIGLAHRRMQERKAFGKIVVNP
ncbi:MAG TPA: zinc-binding dehydrogenase [Patescibacteria group bacterium]|jgi:NADPH:quinone reductase-like Zn-dependent oxidoreductase|nr:zinc-binding dehydrogenase [Patescibacteria group bacterium]